MEGTQGVRGLTPGRAALGARSIGWVGAMAGAFLAALARPRWWAVALASFLLRGGIVVVLLPIITLPTVATLSSLASPTLAAIAFGNPPPEMVATYALLGGLLAAWVAVAVIVGPWLDLALVEEVAADEELGLVTRNPGDDSVVPLGRAVTVRLVAHLGTLAAATYAGIRLVVEGYGEILSPGDPTVPLAWRIALRAPDAFAVLIAAWLLGEGLGSMAVRRVALGDSVAGALGRGLQALLRPSGLATLVVSNVGIVLAVVPLWLAASRAWDQARVMLVDAAPEPLLIATLVLLVVTWCLGLALLAAGLAWRSAAWTAEAYRSVVPAAQGALPSPVATT